MSGFKGYKRRRPGSVHEVISRGYDQAGGITVAAEVLRRDPKRLYDAANPDAETRHKHPLTYEDARLLTRTARGDVTAFAEDLALAAGGAFIPAFDQTGGKLGLLAARFGQETGEALQHIYAALADGVMTGDEAAAALVQVRQAMSALGELYAHVEAVANPADNVTSLHTAG